MSPFKKHILIAQIFPVCAFAVLLFSKELSLLSFIAISFIGLHTFFGGGYIAIVIEQTPKKWWLCSVGNIILCLTLIIILKLIRPDILIGGWSEILLKLPLVFIAGSLMGYVTFILPLQNKTSAQS